MTSLKSNKKRTNSSRNWLVRQLKDPYVMQARDLGYRSRAAFKLIEIDEKYKIFTKNQMVIDLGCAPGGWLQVVTKRVKNGTIIGVDLNEILSIHNVTFIKGDFSEQETITKIFQCLNNRQVDVILSDMASPACGINQVDALRNAMLVRLALNFCYKVSAKSMVAKILRGGEEGEILTEFGKQYQNVSYFKPHSSRLDSSEIYIIGSSRKK
jgi:23S rRNA (uridine2552-2'-O)-methyltransferase